MPDTPFKAMGRERHVGDARDEAEFIAWLEHANRIASAAVTCEKCGGMVREGDWPFCRGEGHAADHNRD